MANFLRGAAQVPTRAIKRLSVAAKPGTVNLESHQSQDEAVTSNPAVPPGQWLQFLPLLRG